MMRPSSLLIERKRQAVQLRNGSRRSADWQEVTGSLRPYESILTEIVDPGRAPEVISLREQVRSWRFYDHFRTDEAAPARQSQVGTRTPVLDHDGRDLAAALQTIIEIGDARALEATVADAFPRSRLAVVSSAVASTCS